MGKPLDPKEVVTVQELVISNMLEIEALGELLFEKGIVRNVKKLAYFVAKCPIPPRVLLYPAMGGTVDIQICLSLPDYRSACPSV